jgi:dTDP-4-amino-4,6-dideoxygalactose transaminase
VKDSREVSSSTSSTSNIIYSDVTNPAVPFADFNLQRETLEADIYDALERVISRGWYILGPEVEAFEQEFANFLGASRAVGVATGTDALSLSLEALGIGHGDEVITSPLTATFTALAISRTGARPVFADVDPTTLNLAVDSVEKRLSLFTKAIIPVHLYGNPCDLPRIMDLARDKALRVVEDACQAHGARIDGKRAGTWGDTGCFSFYPTKNLGALGDGGLVATDDDDLADRLMRLRNGGQSSRYVHDEVGVNSRLDELQAAVLRVKLERLEGWNQRRRDLADVYCEVLKGSPVEPVATTPESESVRHLFVVRAPDREGLCEALVADGVQTLIHYPVPAHLQPAYRDLGQGKGSCPVAEKAAEEILSLPLYPELTEEQVERVANAIRAYYR